MFNDLTVCVVDDDEGVRKLICVLLEGAGFTTVQVACATEAIEIMGKSNTALAIVDLFMPAMSGFELIPVIKQAHPGVKILATSGSGPTYLQRALQAGADAALAKPFRRDELVASAMRLIAA